jgi:hypothetical protein
LSPPRREDELHRGERSHQQAEFKTVRVVTLRVKGQLRQHNAETDKINENGQENDQDGRLPHAVKALAASWMRLAA